MKYADVRAISRGDFRQLFHVSISRKGEVLCAVMQRVEGDEIEILENLSAISSDEGGENASIVGVDDDPFKFSNFYKIPLAGDVIPEEFSRVSGGALEQPASESRQRTKTCFFMPDIMTYADPVKHPLSRKNPNHPRRTA